LVKDKTDVTMTFFIISACFSIIPLLYWAVWAIAIVLDLQLPVQSVHINRSYNLSFFEMFEETKGVIVSPYSKDGQYND